MMDVCVHFNAKAGLCIESHARRVHDADDTVEDTTWTEVRLVIVELTNCERFVLLAFEEQGSGDQAPESPPTREPALLLEFFHQDWPIQSFSEVRNRYYAQTRYVAVLNSRSKRFRLVHWHGPRGRGDYKVLLENENDACAFVQAFLAGRARETWLTGNDSRRLRTQERTIRAAISSPTVRLAGPLVQDQVMGGA
ncbi:hypothetical protein C8Q76DRAFT_693055 [Earliella scabrosa]|nr:hypothetical protein C8Q76DRAFT_693055 [Earliella scabrosa]